MLAIPTQSTSWSHLAEARQLVNLQSALVHFLDKGRASEEEDEEVAVRPVSRPTCAGDHKAPPEVEWVSTKTHSSLNDAVTFCSVQRSDFPFDIFVCVTFYHAVIQQGDFDGTTLTTVGGQKVWRFCILMERNFTADNFDTLPRAENWCFVMNFFLQDHF